MSLYNVDDIVKKLVGGDQKYKIVEVAPLVTTEQKYVCIFEPRMGPGMKMTFREDSIELAS